MFSYNLTHFPVAYNLLTNSAMTLDAVKGLDVDSAGNYYMV